ncbi:MAG TPA: hypothetical protein VFR09_04880 [Alphaproteobacteria bacterium]|nr:hypothetical protein [Alphaproteobacteria bacterium]
MSFVVLKAKHVRRAWEQAKFLARTGQDNIAQIDTVRGARALGHPLANEIDPRELMEVMQLGTRNRATELMQKIAVTTGDSRKRLKRQLLRTVDRAGGLKEAGITEEQWMCVAGNAYRNAEQRKAEQAESNPTSAKGEITIKKKKPEPEKEPMLFTKEEVPIIADYRGDIRSLSGEVVGRPSVSERNIKDKAQPMLFTKEEVPEGNPGKSGLHNLNNDLRRNEEPKRSYRLGTGLPIIAKEF